MNIFRQLASATLLILGSLDLQAQSDYRVVHVVNGGSIAGAVKWAGPPPKSQDVPINKDPAICDPQLRKNIDLERLVVGPDGGVANTIVFLKNISSGKEMNLPEARRSLDQKHCRYEPHILLVPQTALLQMKSSDHVLHTVHMVGAATFNVPFPFVDRTITRNMNTPGLVSLRCNGGHVWMNAEMMVVPHPYYAVTDVNGNFELNAVPPGDYQLVAWHEGWRVLGRQSAVDVFTQKAIQRVVFSEPRTWQQTVTVNGGGTTVVKFLVSEK